MSVAKVRGTENALEATRLRARGLTFREVAAELAMSAPGAHKAVKRGLALIAEQTAEAAEELRARESATLDAVAEAFLPKALAGEERAAEVLLKIRRDYRELNDLGLVRAHEDKGLVVNIDTRFPWERGEVVDEEPAGALEAGVSPS